MGPRDPPVGDHIAPTIATRIVVRSRPHRAASPTLAAHDGSGRRPPSAHPTRGDRTPDERTAAAETSPTWCKLDRPPDLACPKGFEP